MRRETEKGKDRGREAEAQRTRKKIRKRKKNGAAVAAAAAERYGEKQQRLFVNRLPPSSTTSGKGWALSILAILYATRLLFLTCYHIPVRSCLGAAYCIMKCFKELVTSNFVTMDRSHTGFVCRMKDYMPRTVFIAKTVKAVENYFTVEPLNLEVDSALRDTEFLNSTSLLTNQELDVDRASMHNARFMNRPRSLPIYSSQLTGLMVSKT
ncbi:hypothetical protein F0562_012690 [Nyssa sinensis]|uniref:Uncharacterized protein n=1 Tax=Nyssa sinensis TaxID=561372 RepID=A0A5J4ZW30_9ASTE|nr:hypothetical protein F0562_012690 [Nyssa sinensis]